MGPLFIFFLKSSIYFSKLYSLDNIDFIILFIVILSLSIHSFLTQVSCKLFHKE